MASADRPALEAIDRFQLLVDSVDEYAIFMLDRGGLVASWNSGAQRIKGYSATEIIGQHFSRFYPPDDVEAGKPAAELEYAARHGDHRDEGWRVRRDGSRFWAYVVITAVRDPDGSLIGFAKVTRDETERRASEAAVQLLVAEAVRANLAKDEFLSRVSHELRTPLNAILGFGHLLHLAELPEADRECVAQIGSAARHLLGLIDEILDLSRVDSGTLRLSMEPVSVAEVVSEAVGMVAPLADRRGITLERDRSEDDPHVRADRQRLRQVVLNLLSNAVKYSPDGTTVRIDVDQQPHRLRVTVSDTGPGIDDEHLDRLFRPFDRLGAEQTAIEGTGLGLALSKQLTTAMGGEIGVISHPGIGSSFWIELPIAPAGDSIARPVPAPLDAATVVPSSPITVLYVEDNASNIRLMERVLELRPNVTLVVALDGHVGIARARQHRPDLILLDMHLPDIAGDEVLRRLRADPQTANTAIVMVSADAVMDHQRDLIRLGATGYITKPIDVDLLLRQIDAVAMTAASAASPEAADAEPTYAIRPSLSLVPTAAPHQAAVVAPVDDQTVPAAFVAEFIHDLNNVLGVVINYAQLLALDVTNERAAADLVTVRTAAERAVNLTRGLASHVGDRGTTAT